MFCSKCGKQLEEGQNFCPNCGTAQQGTVVSSLNTTVQQSENPTTNTMAVVGFVLGLISLLIDFFGLIGIVAIVLSVAGYMGCKQHNQKGKGRAVFGIIFGLASVLYAFFKLLALSGSF